VAAPLREGGVLAAFLSWAWVEQQVWRMQEALSKNRQIELMVVARNGSVVVGPQNWMGRELLSDRDASEGGDYVIGARTRLRLADNLGLGWTAIVRQRAEVALAPARTTRRTVFLIVFAAGLLSAAAAALASRPLTRRLTRLAAEAEAVRRGERRSLAAPAGADEVSRIGATLAQVVDHLQTEKQALLTLNTELDQRVAERTQRIERMAEEARHAAVTRERLRIARDLHDTLAHSLMALLTQIRLVRKLHGRMDAHELDAELQRAESVASTGLADSRAAIAQMRDNGVRESGLGAALQDLTQRFSQRTGVSARLCTGDEVAKATDERAETVFRIVEEALRNVERHAAAQAVRVDLRNVPTSAQSASITVEVSDDGVGFDPGLPRPGHYGLRGIREQAALIGAHLAVLSAPGQGTRVVLEFEA
jgi:signal transduction histidine kinase